LEASSHKSVRIPVEVGRLDGTLTVPPGATGLVLFVHGSGSNHRSPRNNMIAATLHERGIATLLFDLLTPVEDSRISNRFNVDLLTERLELATDWVRQQPELSDVALGYLGASTGAAAALRAAANRSEQIRAIVSRGGRPDLAGPVVLGQVKAPTLLLVGGRDTSVLALNREATGHLTCEKQMRVITGAKHLFEEPGTLEQVSTQAADWFSDHLADSASQ